MPSTAGVISPFNSFITSWTSSQHFSLVRGRAQKIGGMIGHAERNAVITVPFAAHPPGGFRCLEQCLRRDASQRANHLGPNGLQLPNQIGFALTHFFRIRVAVFRRAAFQHIADEYLLAPHLHALDDDIRQQLSCPAYERFALAIFIGSRRFANEHQFRLRIAYAEDRVLAGFRTETALGAGGHFLRRFPPNLPGHTAF